MSKRKLAIQAILFLGLMGFLTYELIHNWEQVSHSLSQVGWKEIALLVVLQLISFFFRIKSWGLSVKQTGVEIEPGPLHSASGATFLLNCFVPMYIGQWLRIFLLQKWSKSPPAVAQMAVADVLSLFIEAAIIAVFLVISFSVLPFGIWPVIGLVAGCCLIAGAIVYLLRYRSNWEWTHALKIFTAKKDLAKFSGMIFLVMIVHPFRFWVAFHAVGSPENLMQSTLAFAGSVVASILPIGPAASGVGGIVAVTGLDLNQAIAASLVLVIAMAIAALIYLVLSGGFHFIWLRRSELKKLRSEFIAKLKA